MSEHNTLQQQMSAIIAKALKDEAFHGRLLSNPKATMEQEGITLPPGMNVHVYEDIPTTIHLVLPGKLQADEPRDLSDAELEHVAGGWPGFLDNALSSQHGNEPE
jgi:hypothetical protein